MASVLDKHQVLIVNGLRTLKGYEAKIIVEPGMQPRFCKAHPVPYALRGQGIITPVQFADWAAPIVPVVKQDAKSQIALRSQLVSSLTPPLR